MKMKTLTLATSLLLSSLLLPVAANPTERHNGEPLRAALAKLTLTTEQQSAIDALLDENKDQLAEKKTQRKANHDERSAQYQEQQQAMQALMEQENFDEAAALALIEQRQQQQVQQQLAMMKLHHQLGQLLTAEQRAELRELLQQPSRRHEQKSKSQRQNREQ